MQCDILFADEVKNVSSHSVWVEGYRLQCDVCHPYRIGRFFLPHGTNESGAKWRGKKDAISIIIFNAVDDMTLAFPAFTTDTATSVRFLFRATPMQRSSVRKITIKHMNAGFIVCEHL